MASKAAPKRANRGLGFTLVVGTVFILLWPPPLPSPSAS